MSHTPAHVFGPATTEIVTNAAGERQAVLVCYCTSPGCGERQELSGGVFETPQTFKYARTLEEHSEPDD